MARYGAKDRVMFASALVLGVLNNFAQGKLQLRQGEDTYGLKVTNYVSPFGTLSAIYHPLFEGTTYGGYAVALDMSQAKYCNLKGRDTLVRENIQENDRDGRKDELLTEAGVKLGFEKKAGKLLGVTS
jgi:hypothetical protein